MTRRLGENTRGAVAGASAAVARDRLHDPETQTGKDPRRHSRRALVDLLRLLRPTHAPAFGPTLVEVPLTGLSFLFLRARNQFVASMRVDVEH